MDELLVTEKDDLLEFVRKELFKDRIIYLNEDISCFTIDNIVPLIHYFNKQDEKNNIPAEEREPIHLHIISYGGSAYDGFQIVSTIENSVTPVYTYVEGYAMSMALPIFLAGHKRFMGQYAVLLYHELSGDVQGARQNIKRLDKEFDRIQKMYDEYIISRTKITQEMLNEHQKMVNDWYIDVEEAAKYHMFDELI